MSLSLEQLFPTARMGFGDAGFLFGCGTSKEAGYPLTSELTKKVIEGLPQRSRDVLGRILQREGLRVDDGSWERDIEEISDAVAKHRVETGDSSILECERRIRASLVNVVASLCPCLGNHERFFKTLRSKLDGKASRIWIFTTNYDPLFELAADATCTPLVNGFCGIRDRYFDYDQFLVERGRTKGQRFEPEKRLKVILVKLHGSVWWYKDGQKVVEVPSKMNDREPAIVLPRRSKVLATLEHPYNKLFRYSSEVLGGDCKYLVSCGFSYRDQHIVDSLLAPKLANGSIRLFALFGEDEPRNLSGLTRHRSFNYATPTRGVVDGAAIAQQTDAWQFSKFVDLIGT